MYRAAPHTDPPASTLLNLNAVEQLRAGRLWRRLSQLLIGLIGYGVAVMMLVQSGLGAASWNVLAEGIAHRAGLSFGLVTNVIALVVLLAWIPLREMPGVGTLLNVMLVGLAADSAAMLLPPAASWPAQIAYLVVGLLMLAFFDALYLGAQLGAGPRDGIMTGLTRVTGQPVPRVRTCIEIVVASSGWLLGGTLGVGTLVIAFFMGPLLGRFLPWVIVAPTHPVGTTR